MKKDPEMLQIIRNLVYGNVEKLNKEEMKELEIDPEELPPAFPEEES